MHQKIQKLFVVFVVGMSLCWASLASAAKDVAAREDVLKFKGKITALSGSKPVNGRVPDIQITVTNESGEKNVFIVKAMTRVVDKTDKRPTAATTISPGRNVVVKYEIKDGVNNARVLKILE
ncbi:MAG: hypothetical protein V2A70_08030 [Candidatus Omnitrophota bacterium]